MSEEIRKGDFSHANLRGARIAGEDLLPRMEGKTFSQVYESREYLEGEGLFSAVLRGVKLRGADLTGADLHRVDLSRAVLEQAVLLRSDLRGAVLNQADLQRADLEGADLREAGLFRANLSGACLRTARLEGARLRESSLRGADLRGARVRGADLQGADLEGAIVDAGEWLVSSGARLDLGRWSLVRIAPDGFVNLTGDQQELGNRITISPSPLSTSDYQPLPVALSPIPAKFSRGRRPARRARCHRLL